MDSADRRSRAEARHDRVTLRKSRLSSREEDLSPVFGAEAIALAQRLTEESWSLSGQELPGYTRDHIPWRFIPRRLT